MAYSGGPAKRHFYIVSQLNKKVLDIKGAHAAVNTKVIMYDKQPGNAANQLWYLDPQGYIRSSLNDMVFFHPTKGQSLHMVIYTGEPGQQWRFENNKIVNGQRSCLDIRGEHSSNGSELCAYDYKGMPNQHWTMTYI